MDLLQRIREETHAKIILDFLEQEHEAMVELHIPENQLTAVRMMLHMQRLKVEKLSSLPI